MSESTPQHEVTRLLQATGASDRAASDQLLVLVYDQLRRAAQLQMRNERPGNTLSATALVHEAYLRLVGKGEVHWEGRGHFFGAAAEAMRRILIERARRKAGTQQGGGRQRVALPEGAVVDAEDPQQVLAVSEALERLVQEDPRKADLVKLRYFAGLTIAEAAEVMGISHATAERYWAYSRLRLYQWISE